MLGDLCGRGGRAPSSLQDNLSNVVSLIDGVAFVVFFGVGVLGISLSFRLFRAFARNNNNSTTTPVSAIVAIAATPIRICFSFLSQSNDCFNSIPLINTKQLQQQQHIMDFDQLLLFINSMISKLSIASLIQM